jgi:hypothetical protein
VNFLRVIGVLVATTFTPYVLAQNTTSESLNRRARGEWRTLAMLRVGGGLVLLRDTAFETTAWTVDVHAGVRFLDARQPGKAFWMFGGDLGISIGPRGNETIVLALGGPSVSYGSMWLSVGWSPRLVLGDVAEHRAVGLRNTVSLCVMFGLGCVDAAHQYLSIGEGSQHDLRLTMSVDVGMAAQFILQFAALRPG